MTAQVIQFADYQRQPQRVFVGLDLARGPDRTAFHSRASGGELRHGVNNVWAIAISRTVIAVHYWRFIGNGYLAICGAVARATLANGQCNLFAPGTYPRCPACVAAMTRGDGDGDGGRAA